MLPGQRGLSMDNSILYPSYLPIPQRVELIV